MIRYQGLEEFVSTPTQNMVLTGNLRTQVNAGADADATESRIRVPRDASIALGSSGGSGGGGGGGDSGGGGSSGGGGFDGGLEGLSIGGVAVKPAAALSTVQSPRARRQMPWRKKEKDKRPTQNQNTGPRPTAPALVVAPTPSAQPDPAPTIDPDDI